MAHKKAGGSTSLGRDSASQRLGVKLYAGEHARPGMVIGRPRGTAVRPGKNVARGEDDTLYAKVGGIVRFAERKVTKFTGHRKKAMFVHVDPTKQE